MRTVIPGSVSPQYIAVLREHQIRFLDEITEPPEVTARYDDAHQKWIDSIRSKIKRG